MNRLIESAPAEIIIDGMKYQIDTGWEPAVFTWSAYAAYEAGELSELGYLGVLIEKMFLEPKPDIFNEKALRFAFEYLNAFSDKDGDRKTNMPPIDIEQDSGMIYSAMLSMGVHLRRDKITYEDFLSYLRELPEGCEYARIMHLRNQYYNNRAKMTKEEKAACARIGWDKIRVRNRRRERETADNREFFKQKRNELRAARGLPPK